LGQDLTYRCGETVYECRISRADWQLIQSLREHLPAEAELLFVVPALGAEVSIPTTELRAATARVEAFLAEDSDLLPHTYQFKYDRPPDPQMAAGFHTGGMSGLRLSGDDEHYYAIHAGLNECYLQKWEVSADGHGVLLERRDLRDVRELQTQNLGKITIRRIRTKARLRQIVAEIRKFLQNVTAPNVSKIVD